MSPEAVTENNFSAESDVVGLTGWLLFRYLVPFVCQFSFPTGASFVSGHMESFCGNFSPLLRCHIKKWTTVKWSWSYKKDGGYHSHQAPPTACEFIIQYCVKRNKGTNMFWWNIYFFFWRYELMIKCWRQDLPGRPSFSHIVRFLEGARGEKILLRHFLATVWVISLWIICWWNCICRCSWKLLGILCAGRELNWYPMVIQDRKSIETKQFPKYWKSHCLKRSQLLEKLKIMNHVKLLHLLALDV